MIPSFGLRLDCMRRAMSEVIMPAIDPANSLAVEQAALLVGHISMMMQQWDKLDAYARLCLDDLRETVCELDPSGGSATRDAAAALDKAFASEEGSAETAFRAAAAALEELVRVVSVDGNPIFCSALEAAVLAFSRRQSLRERSWFAMSGFDVNAAQLPSIAEMVGGSGDESHGL